MDLITFPKNEWDDIRTRLDDGKKVWSVRVSDEYGKFNAGDTVRTEWGSEARIVSVKKIRGGVATLKDEYPFFDELTEKMLDELRGHDRMEILTLETVSKRAGLRNYAPEWWHWSFDS